MRVLVTGGAGFIGSHIVDELIQNNIEVYVIDNLSSGKIENINKNIKEFFHMNIRDQAVEDIFKSIQPDVVIHHAAQVSVSYSLKAPFVDAEENILSTIALLELCHKYSVGKFIFASTAAIYGKPKSLPIYENNELTPISYYGLSKKTCEEYIKMYHELYGLDYVILRYSNVYGERQTTDGEAGVISLFIDKFNNQESPIIFGDGLQTRDFIYVKDIAQANLKAIQSIVSGIYNISTNTSLSLLDVLSYLNNVYELSLVPIFQSTRLGDIKHSYLANNIAQETLGWLPMYSFEEGIKSMYENIKLNYESVRY